MFSFLSSIVGKIASAVVSVFVAVGLISAPASVAPQPLEQPIIVETVATSSPVVEKEIDIKAELDALKKQLADEQSKRKDLEKKIVAPTPKPTPSPTPTLPTPATSGVGTPTSPSASVGATPPPAVPTPTVQLLPGQFLLPSGAIVDSTGKVIKEAPLPTVAPTPTPIPTPTPSPTPTPTWPPADGSTVDIQQSLISNINFNSHLTCDQLWSVPPSKKDLCKLYKDNSSTSKYIWNIINDISQ